MPQSKRSVLITACSETFYDHYVDLLDSIAAVGVPDPFDLGLIDLGINEQQRAQLIARGVRIVAARWPIEPPARQNQLHLIAFAAKPFAPDFFPGYDMYVWIDADMWVQTAEFWTHLVGAAWQHGAAVTVESDPGYRRMPMSVRLWMLRHFYEAWGPVRTLKLMSMPMVNNGYFAMRGDAPHWTLWQQRFRTMVSKTGRMLAIDQLAIMAMIAFDEPVVVLFGSAYNWVCSLGTPAYDLGTGRFTKPNAPNDAITLMHITTPARTRRFPVRNNDGTVLQRYLHRPGGRVIEALEAAEMTRDLAQAPNARSTVTNASIGAPLNPNKAT